MRNKYTNLGWLMTIVIGSVPAVLWLIAMPTQWNTTKNVFENLGKLAGLTGMALFAWNVILSARFKVYNKLFMGLDNTYRAHHIIGSLSFILLLIHPVLITYRYFLSSPISAFEFLKPSFESPFRFLGSLTLAGMILAMFVTIYLSVKYELFIKAQITLGFLLFIGAIHAVFVGASDLGLKGGVLTLQLYFAVLILLAAIVYFYRSVFHGNFSKFLSYEVTNLRKSGDIYEISLSPIAGTMKYLPGQFAFIKADAPGLMGQSHPFSLSSSPDEKTISFGIKSLGDYTKLLEDVKKGQQFKIDGPYGTFSNKIVNNSRQIWIAGGIGVTPFVAMAKALDDSQTVDLYYSTKNDSECVYRPELEEISKQKSNFNLILFNAEKQGFLTLDIITNKSQNLENANFMICGPQAMMDSFKSQLKTAGVKKKNINTEEFNLS